MKLNLKFILTTGFLIVGMTVLAKPVQNTKLPLPGKTMGNIKLQADTLMPVYVAASSKVKGCKNFSIVDTQVTKRPYDLKTQNGRYIAGKWEELWTVNACGKKVYVPVSYIMDKTGATYVINNNEVK